MVTLASFYWGWLLGAALLGFGMGWIAVVHRGHGLSKAAAGWLGLLLVVLLGLALARVVPGRPGYWLDLGLVLLAIYLAGCSVGSWLRYWVVSRHESAA
ncbi:apolipoprotein N-acyltransferase [Rhodopseudomonas rhenobacensis]|uniref:Apolipoprotein N-acyltransferase n=1 Tax=Rhodopseudomonas rhenobacensis TaxID=87461 RepID=A0A7W8DWY4_9BRAD|nr:hypothetical protein [Rhodopseudomonas rhenobacensis]MBB5045333.1 apolipoprotein N-acyltransferase [Rhodopseudomonas rhenobacensis]